MCFPAAIALGPLLTAASTVVSVIGTVQQGRASAAASEAAEQQNRNNAIIAQRNAEDARQRGAAAEQDVQLRNRARIGMQKNAFSERSISIAGGTALDVLGDTAMFGKLDALTTRQNFEREAIAAETQRYNFNAQADLDRMSAANARTSAGISAFSTALGGASQIYKDTRKPRL